MCEPMKYLPKHSHVQMRTCAHIQQPCTDANTPTSTPKCVGSLHTFAHTHAYANNKKYCLIYKRLKKIYMNFMFRMDRIYD